MVNSIIIAFNQLRYCFCQVKCVCWTSHFIINNSDLRMIFCKFKHCLWEISSVYTVKPCCSYDEKFIKFFCNFLFTSEFAFTINADRSHFIIFKPWTGIFTVKYIICTYVNQNRSVRITCAGQISTGITINTECQISVLLTSINIRICCSINNNIRLFSAYNIHHLLFIGDVQCFGSR